jgi:hypothetical protein
MKHIIIIFTLLFTFSSAGQGLNDTVNSMKNGKYVDLKDGGIGLYQAVKTFSVNKWKDDHQMVLHEINQQIDSVIQFIELSARKETDLTILVKSLEKWSDKKPQDSFFTSSTNWRMVMHEYKTQIEAKKAY